MWNIATIATTAVAIIVATILVNTQSDMAKKVGQIIFTVLGGLFAYLVLENELNNPTSGFVHVMAWIGVISSTLCAASGVLCLSLESQKDNVLEIVCGVAALTCFISMAIGAPIVLLFFVFAVLGSGGHYHYIP